MSNYNPAWHNPERQRTNMRRSKYGMEQNQFDYLLDQQNGLCPICRVSQATHVDHDHDTGAVRGLLCNTCNRAIGLLRDESATLQRAADYLSAEPPKLPDPVRVNYPGGRRPHVCGQRNRCPGKDELVRMYVTENWLLSEIGERLGLPAPSVYRYLEIHEIPRRGNTGRGGRPTRTHVCGRDNVCPGEASLREVYHGRGLSLDECCSALNLTSRSMFYAYLRAHDIERRALWARNRAAA